jgi:hypothetical protein
VNPVNASRGQPFTFRTLPPPPVYTKKNDSANSSKEIEIHSPLLGIMNMKGSSEKNQKNLDFFRGVKYS